MKKFIKLLFLMVLYAGCVQAPTPSSDCKEFDYRTLRDGHPFNCRMVFCVGSVGTDITGGPAVLWCNEQKPATDE